MLYLYWREQISRALRTVIRYGERPQPAVTKPVHFARCAERKQIALLVPPRGNINHPEFIEQLERDLKPNIALSYFCLKKFSPELLSLFDYTVNYHNGLLPEYKGLKATAWSVYSGDPETGFSFHRMVEDLDQGHILLQGSVPIRKTDRTTYLDLAKAELAAEKIPAMLQMVADRYPGKAQTGEGSYFSYKDYRAIVRIADPEALSGEELARRLRAFVLLEIFIGNSWYSVTGARPAANSTGTGRKLCFRTADGVMMQVTHIDFLPRAVFRARAFARRFLKPER
jgi:methionyl-tRNA formyltransferase